MGIEKNLPDCFDKNIHKGDFLIEIQRVSSGGCGQEEVIYWCKRCGGIVIDYEVDRRRVTSIRPMQWPDVIAIK